MACFLMQNQYGKSVGFWLVPFVPSAVLDTDAVSSSQIYTNMLSYHYPLFSQYYYTIYLQFGFFKIKENWSKNLMNDSN